MVVLKNVYKFYVNVGWTYWLSSNGQDVAAVTLWDFQGEVIKRTASSWLAGTLRLLTLGEPSWHAVRILKQFWGTAHMERNSALPLTANTNLPAMGVSHLESNPVAPVMTSDYNSNILTSTPWETLNQNHTAKPLLNSWLAETMRDNKCLYCLKNNNNTRKNRKLK